MESNNTKDKVLEKSAKSAPATKQDDDLEPCEQPQAQEASRLHAPDEACDDGVN